LSLERHNRSESDGLGLFRRIVHLKRHFRTISPSLQRGPQPELLSLSPLRLSHTHTFEVKAKFACLHRISRMQPKIAQHVPDFVVRERKRERESCRTLFFEWLGDNRLSEQIQTRQ
jgi:hypothetical protein